MRGEGATPPPAPARLGVHRLQSCHQPCPNGGFAGTTGHRFLSASRRTRGLAPGRRRRGPRFGRGGQRAPLFCVRPQTPNFARWERESLAPALDAWDLRFICGAGVGVKGGQKCRACTRLRPGKSRLFHAKGPESKLAELGWVTFGRRTDTWISCKTFFFFFSHV